MGTLTQADREFWRGVLVAGGFSAIPRWTLDPVPGVAEHEVPLPHDLVDVVAALGEPDQRDGLSAALLAAHAAVLAALCGEREVVTGYVAEPDGRPLPCRLSTDPGSWRALLRETSGSAAELRAHRDFPVEDLRRELGMTEPAFETVLDPTPRVDGEGTGHLDLDEHVVLGVGVARRGDGLALRLRYRTDVLDAEAAARIAGYHLAALTLLATDPDAEHGRQTLLSREEVEYQVEGLAGPRYALPDQRMHELFEQRVAAHPDAVAAVHRDRQWTYRELNARANQLSRALLARGLRREGVVAVVTERNLDWMAAVLAIFKAGGAYLPIEPHFPAERIAKALSRSDCQLALTEPDSRTTLDEALDSLPGVRSLSIDAAYTEGHAEDNLGVAVAPDQLAYLLFTSGSTGEPKGAMCEHAGMLNHIYAKLLDLEATEGEVIPQTGPQCFDISVWQLVAALVVGGRTLLVDQEVILDVERFVDTIVTGRAGVLQVVPSYLDVIVSYLEQHPRELPDLHSVSPTGDFLKRELVQRWFAVQPRIKLVNTYGLTETSDDAVHEVMDRVPDEERVPLGRPIINVHVYVVDENLSPVPLGAPGMICFSGVCVGRGYVNDPERTRQLFMADPHRPGERLCRTGDYGRWLPNGKLDFLGRRDNQVKIRGFRIEIGEVENALLRVPGVRDGAAVVAEGADRTKRLVAFYFGPGPIEADVLRARVAEAVPEYMVPSAFHWRESLPLTPNGKIDRKALTALAAELAAGDVDEQDHQAPTTPTERRLADAWAKLLGVPPDQVGRGDNFFERGGTSLTAVKLVIALKKEVSIKDVTAHPVLADLAALLDGRAQPDTGLLSPLREPDATPAATLVCFPYAGGNAVNFQPMAMALRGSGIAVYAVELPGHDVAARGEPFAPLPQVVEQVVNEITARGLTRVLLWGHSTGTAFAVATARRLHERGVDVQRVFLGAYLPGDASTREAAVGELSSRTNTEIAAMLASDSGYTELGELDAERAEHVGAAYRHDCLSVHHYLADAMAQPPATKLAAPVTVVVAGDDPKTAGAADRYRGWQLLAEQVELHELADGGHYFPRTRPAEAARAVLHGLASLTSA